MHSMETTINLLDVDSWCECNNALEGFKDTLPRVLAYFPNYTFILRVSYKDFDALMLQVKKDYNVLDDRSINLPDRQAYKGLIQANVTSRSDMLAVTFHRKGFIPKDYEDFVYHHLFSNINPMN